MLIAGAVAPPISTSSRGPKPHRHATGMPWMLPLGESSLVLKSACASSHNTRSFLPSSRQWRATALIEPMLRAVIAAEQDRQAAQAQLGKHRVVHRAIPVHHLRAGGGSPRAAAARDWPGPLRLPRSNTCRPRASQRGLQSRPRAAPRGPSTAPRAPAPMSVGAPMRLACRPALTRHTAAGRRHASGGPRRQQAEQVLRIVEIRNEVDLLLRAAQLLVNAPQIAQRGEVLERETDRIENGDLAIAHTAGPAAREHVGQLGDHEVRLHLLDLAFDPRLRLELHHDPHIGPAQNVRMQLGLAGAIATDRVQVHARSDHVRSQDDGVAFVRCDRRNDVSTLHGSRGRCTAHDAEAAQTQGREIALELVVAAGSVSNRRTSRIPSMWWKRDRLELALRAVADQRHDPAVRPRHATRRQGGSRGRA